METKIPDNMHDQFCVSAQAGLESAFAELIDAVGGLCTKAGIPRKRIFGVLMAALAGQLFDTVNMQIGHGLGLEETEAPKHINLKRLDMVQRQTLHCIMAVARARYPKEGQELIEILSKHGDQGTADRFNEDIKRSMT